MSAGEAKSAAAPARAVDDDEEKKEGEICAICLEALPRFGHGAVWYTCCGKSIHKECEEQFMNSGCDKNCPMCRAPVATDEQNHTRALRWARKGKAWAMVIIACNFELGRGVSASKEMKRLWFEKAAEQGYAKAQYNLGLMHSNGEGGLPVSKEKARLLYEKAAEQEHPKAQYNLGVMHFDGEGGLPVSKEKARLWFENAAEQGHPCAQYNLGTMHSNGEGGLPVSKEKARLWYEKSAEQEYPNAQHNLGVMHYNGEGGLPVSKEKALLWLKRAAEQGFEFAITLIDTAFKYKCFSCGNTGAMKCCSRCKCAYYCSRDCQAAAWKSGHKATCKQIRRMQKTKK